MSILDSLLGQLGGNVDVAAIAAKVGIDPAVAQTAVAALGVAHSQEGDTVEAAAAKTGLDSGTLLQIVETMGGTMALGQLNSALQAHPQIAGLVNMADSDGDGNPLNDLMGMAKGMFSKS